MRFTALEAIEEAVIYLDGASSGNPGPAGIGVIIKDVNGKDLVEYSEFLGQELTNNQAEYLAVIRGLQLATSLIKGAKKVKVVTDSELIVRQMTGTYSVRSENIRPLFLRAKELERSFEAVTYVHVPRDFNARADELARKAIERVSLELRG